jgi:hypothetical protein
MKMGLVDMMVDVVGELGMSFEGKMVKYVRSRVMIVLI